MEQVFVLLTGNQRIGLAMEDSAASGMWMVRQAVQSSHADVDLACRGLFNEDDLLPISANPAPAPNKVRKRDLFNIRAPIAAAEAHLSHRMPCLVQSLNPC